MIPRCDHIAYQRSVGTRPCSLTSVAAAAHWIDIGLRSFEEADHFSRQPYLDTDMQSRFFDYGGDTIIRADQYEAPFARRASLTCWLQIHSADV